MKHTDIRAAVLDALEQHEHGATLFDGRPVVFDEEDARGCELLWLRRIALLSLC